MSLIDDEVAAQLRQEFQRQLEDPVRLVVFYQTLADPASEQVRRLVEELCTLDERLMCESLNFVLERERAEALGVARTPAVAILGQDKDYGLRLYGQPSGYEFGTLVDAIVDVSRHESTLASETLAALAALKTPVHLQVFSTPTCPYCPRAARLAFQFALASEQVTADSIEVTSFPDLARRYRVSSVPMTVIGDSLEFVGAQGEDVLLQHVQDAAGRSASGLTS